VPIAHAALPPERPLLLCGSAYFADA